MNALTHAILFQMRDKGVNLNTAFLTAISGLLIFGGKEFYAEMRVMHDSMIEVKKDLVTIRNDMVQKTEYEVEITGLKARMASAEARQSQTEARQAQIEIEIQKWKNNK